MEVVLPKWGVTMQEATVVEWLVAVGDVVTEGQPIVTIGTDKVDTDIESPIAGTIVSLNAEEDEEVPVGAVLFVVE